MSSSTSQSNFVPLSDSINVRLGSLKRNRNLNNYHTNSDLTSTGDTGRVSWDYFDENAYVSRGALREGEDPYLRNRFNQQASDALPSNRDIPDTRHPM